MRSKLEQRFAAYLDSQPWHWIYEPATFQIDFARWYTPDFLVCLSGPQNLYVELKPTLELAFSDDRIRKLSRIVPDFCMTVYESAGWTGLVVGQDTLWHSELEDLQFCIDCLP